MMKETSLFIASLTIIGVAVISALILLYAIALTIADRRKKKTLYTLRLALKDGDKKAELKLKEQLLFFEKRVEDAQFKLRTAEKELQNFKTIYELCHPKNTEENRIVRLPKSLNNFLLKEKPVTYSL